MSLKKKVVVVMPAHNAQMTIEKTWRDVMEQEVVDLVIVVDDDSQDATLSLAAALDKVVAHAHPRNLGYGANQKTCYRLALAHGADIVVMVHPDYQYSPKLIPAVVGLVSSGVYSCVLGSRILGGQALSGGMPACRYVANRALTLVGNALHDAFRGPYRMPRVLPRVVGASSARSQLRRLRVRQRDLGGRGVAGIAHWRDVVSDPLRARCLVHHFSTWRPIWVRAPPSCRHFPPREGGAPPFPQVPLPPADRDVGQLLSVGTTELVPCLHGALEASCEVA
jgi:glycosyltransferase involved in cell wall biosynthesis